MPEMCYAAEIAVFNTRQFQWTPSNYMLSATGETVDEVGRRLLRIGGI